MQSYNKILDYIYLRFCGVYFRDSLIGYFSGRQDTTVHQIKQRVVWFDDWHPKTARDSSRLNLCFSIKKGRKQYK
jgi:hypothetical protein